VQGQPGQIVCETLPGKYPIQKRTGRAAQVIQRLTTKCEALSSTPSTTTKEIKKKLLMGILHFFGTRTLKSGPADRISI
jgi:hypothetical protein